MKLLFIEDDRTFFNWICESMSAHTCVLAETIEKAEELLAWEKFDACFVDLRMPKYSAIEIVARARAANEKVPLIVLTGMEARCDLANICDGYLYKGALDDPAHQIPHAVQTFTDIRRGLRDMDITGQLFSALRSLRQQHQEA